MAFGRTVEVCCSRCQRRYAVADHKVVGRRRTSRCRCGNLLIFDGRALSSAGLEGITADVQPLEPTLTPSGAPAETIESSAPLSIPPLSIPAAPLPLELEAASAGPTESSTAEPAADSQTIGRIRLRRTEQRSESQRSESQRPRAPGTRVEHSPSKPPESPRSLHEAFDSLDLDRLAESIRPTWEAPPSRRVTPPGEDPEVVVHYPAEWQPPPSERRRLRATWEVTPTLPLSFGPPPSDALDDDWETPATEAPLPAAPPEPASPAPAAEASADLPVAAEAAPESQTRVGKSGGPGLDSTAPTAVSQPPLAAPPRSSAKLWGVGLAAAAVLGLAWRSANTRATEPTAADAPAAHMGEASGSNEPALAPATPAATPPEPANTPAPEAADTLAPPPTPPTTDTPSAAPVLHAAPPTPPAPPLPAQRPPSAAAGGRPPTAPIGHATPPPAPAAASIDTPAAAPTATPPEPAPSVGPDPAAVARALGIAAARARACAAPDAPAGNGSVRVLLDPAGGVLNATALGAFQGTPTGSCVEAQFRTASTPAYDGRTLSTLYPFGLDAQ